MNKILLVMLFSISLYAGGKLEVGSSITMLNDYEYETPKGYMMKIPPKSKLILVAFEKDTAKTVNDYLKMQEKYYIQKNNAVFISDISNMPKIITHMFALPKMKKFEHLIYLQYSGKFEKLVPHKDDKITLLKIKEGKITDISYVKSTKAVKEAIEK